MSGRKQRLLTPNGFARSGSCGQRFSSATFDFAVENEEAQHFPTRIMPARWHRARPLALGCWHFPSFHQTVSTRPIRKSFLVHLLRSLATKLTVLARPSLRGKRQDGTITRAAVLGSLGSGPVLVH